MKKTKLVLTAIALSAFSLSAMANVVQINNNSSHPLQIKYRLAYKNRTGKIELTPVHIRIPHNSSVRVKVRKISAYDLSGLVVTQVKVHGWQHLPSYVTDFGGKPGCWVAKRANGVALSGRQLTFTRTKNSLECEHR